MAKQKPPKYPKPPHAAPPSKGLPPGEGPRQDSLIALVRAELPRLGLVFGIALILRLVYLGFLARPPLFDTPQLDGAVHDLWAQSIAGHGDPDNRLWQDQPFFRAPLYAYFLGFLSFLSGGGDFRFWLYRIVQFVMGAANCALLGLIGIRLYGRRVGMTAGLIAAFTWILIYFDGELLMEGLLVFLDLLAVLALIEAERRPRWTGFLLSGILLGLSAIARPNILLLLPFILVWMFLVLRRRMPTRGIARQAGILVLGTFLCILPVTLRNVLVGHDFVLIASQGGYNLYIGNNPQSDGTTAWVPGTRRNWWGGYSDAVAIAERDLGRTAKPSEVSRYYTRKSLAFLREYPDLAARLYWRKLRLLFDNVEHSNNQNIYFFRAYTKFLTLPIFLGFWLILPFGVAGMIANRKDRHWALFTGFILIYLASFLPFFVTSRYRVPVIPFLILLASVFIWNTIAEYRRRHWSRFARGVGLLAILFVLFRLNSSEVPPHDPSRPESGQLVLGNAFYTRGDLEQAEAHLKTLVDYHEPYRSRALMQLGRISFKRGDGKGARTHFMEALQADAALFPEVTEFLRENGGGALLMRLVEEKTSDPQEKLREYEQLTGVLVREGKFAEAVAYYKRMLELDPSNLSTHTNLGIIYMRNPATYEQGIALFREGLESHPGDVGLLSNLAGAYFVLGRLDEAEAIITKELLPRDPQNPRYRQMLDYISQQRAR